MQHLHVGPLAGGADGTVGDSATLGVLTVSDRASAGVYEDLSGPAILACFGQAIASRWHAVYRVTALLRLACSTFCYVTQGMTDTITVTGCGR